MIKHITVLTCMVSWSYSWKSTDIFLKINRQACLVLCNILSFVYAHAVCCHIKMMFARCKDKMYPNIISSGLGQTNIILYTGKARNTTLFDPCMCINYHLYNISTIMPVIGQSPCMELHTSVKSSYWHTFCIFLQWSITVMVNCLSTRRSHVLKFSTKLDVAS